MTKIVKQVKSPLNLNTNLPDAGDLNVRQIKSNPNDNINGLTRNLPDAGGDTIVRASKSIPKLNTQLPQSGNETTAVPPSRTPKLNTELPQANDTNITQGKSSAKLNLELPQSQDLVVSQAKPRANINTELPQAQDLNVTQRRPIPKLNPQLPQADDLQFDKFNMDLGKGKWIAKGDPMMIGAENFSELDNFRYTDWGLEGVGGTTLITTTDATTIQSKIQSGIQLRTNYGTNYTIVQDTTATNSHLQYKTLSIPNADGVGYTDLCTLTGQAKGRFAKLPNNTIGFCNQSQNYIWAGDESEISAFLKCSTITPTTNYENFYNLTDIVNNSLHDSANIVSITDSVTDELYYWIGTTRPTTKFKFYKDAVSDPFDVTVSNNVMRFSYNNGGGTAYYNATLTAGTYTGATLAAALQALLRAGLSCATITVVFNTTGAKIGLFSFSPGDDKTLTYEGTGVSTGCALFGFTTTSRGGTPGLAWDSDFIASNVTFKYWNGAAWTASTLSADTTRTNGVALTTDGTITISGMADEQPIYINGKYLYFYIMTSACVNSDIYNITVYEAPVGVTNIWDGVPRIPIGFLFRQYDGTWIIAAGERTLKMRVSEDAGATWVGGGTGWADMDITADTYTNGSALATEIQTQINTHFSTTGILFVWRNAWQRFEFCAASSDRIVQIDLSEGSAVFAAQIGLTKDLSSSGFAYADLSKVAPNGYNDLNYTLEVSGASGYTSSVVNPIVVPFGAGILDASIDNINEKVDDYVIFGFNEPTTAIEFYFNVPEKSNEMHVCDIYCWNGATWVITDLEYNTTFVSPSNFRKDGAIYFTIPAGTLERPTTYGGVKGYYYKMVWTDATHTTLFDTMYLSRIWGVPKYNVLKNNYVFPFQYRNRAMLCGSVTDKEYNRVDYSVSNAPDVWNGADSSGYYNERSLKFGSNTALTGACELFGEYGLSVESIALFFKNDETHMLMGSSATGEDSFKIHKVSNSIGCPAPNTITVAEAAFKVQDSPAQNVVLWLSDKGPVMFVNNTIMPIGNDVSQYFDAYQTSTCIPSVYISVSHAWYGQDFNEWNLIIPSGSSATECNVWLIYDIGRNRWRKNNCTYMFPYGNIQVQDTNGIKYTYLWSYVDMTGSHYHGYLLRAENGILWGESASYKVTPKFTTSDFFFGSDLWSQTVIRRLETFFKTDATGTLTVDYYKDGKLAAETTTNDGSTNINTVLPTDKVMYVTNGTETHRIRRLITSLNLPAQFHRLSFYIESYTTKPTIMAISILFQLFRELYLDKDNLN